MDEGKITVDLGDVKSFIKLDDGELEGLLMLTIAEQKRRALENNDVNALIEDGFEKGFLSTGMSKEPWLKDGLLICAGNRLDKSGTSHMCSFVHVGEDWVWDSSDKIYDEVRNIPGAKPQMRSVTIIGAYEGMKFDFITSRTRGGIHERVSSKSFIIKNGALEATKINTKKPQNHR